jgi:hypothetical protein
MEFILCKTFATAGRCVDKPLDGLVTDLVSFTLSAALDFAHHSQTSPQNSFSARCLLWQGDVLTNQLMVWALDLAHHSQSYPGNLFSARCLLQQADVLTNQLMVWSLT